MQSFLKQVNETKTYSIDFSPALASGETITLGNITTSSINYLTGATASIIMGGSVGLTGGTISFRVTGGTADVPYKLTVKTGNTNYANNHEEDLLLLVVDDITLLYTVDELKNSLGITGTAQDAVLYSIVRSASDFAENYCHRKFTLKEYTEVLYPRDSRTCILLENFPIQSVSSITIGGEALPETNSDGSKNWIIEDGCYISRIDGGSFLKRPVETVITHKAGYPILPEDLRGAVKKIASEEYNMRKKGGLMGEDIGNYKVLYNTKLSSLETPTVIGTLSRYMKTLF